MVRRRSTVGSAVLASALVLVVALAASPVNAAAKNWNYLAVQYKPINVTASDLPPNYGSEFPVTVTGQLDYGITILGRKGNPYIPLKKGSKLRKKARARCPVGGVTLPLIVAGFQGGVGVRSLGSTVTDSSGAFSGVVEFNPAASGGSGPGTYQGGVPLNAGVRIKAGKIGGRPVTCTVESGFSSLHSF